MKISKYTKDAIYIAKKAGEFLKKGLKEPLKITKKEGIHNLVTNCDLFSEKMVIVEKWNKKSELKDRLKKQLENSESLTESLGQIKEEKEARIKNAKMPVDGLSFSKGDIAFNGVEFSEISSAQKIKVSMAMAMAMNPKLKVIRILNGSLLDDGAMKAIEEIAVENDFQIFVERVSNQKNPNTIYIEDGQIK